MGNWPNCFQTEISFEYQNDQNIINLFLIKTEFSDKIEEIILKDIKQKDQKFIDILNIIITNSEKINKNKIIVLKETVESILSNISNKEKKNLNISSIDKYIKNKYDFKAIIQISELFKLIYLKKDEIETDEIKFFIKVINLALKGTNILDEPSFQYFFEIINEIFFGKNGKEQENQNSNNNQKKEEMEKNNNSKIKNIEIIPKKENQNILIDDEYNKSNESKNEEKNKNKNNNLIEENNFKFMNYEIQKINSDFTPYLKKEFEQIFIDKTLKDVENAMSSQKSKSKSNFSNYSEDSKKQILKMKDEINQIKN